MVDTSVDETKITPKTPEDASDEILKVVDKYTEEQKAFLGDEFMSRKFDDDEENTLDLTNEEEEPEEKEEVKTESQATTDPGEAVTTSTTDVKDAPVLDEEKIVESVSDKVKDQLVKDFGLTAKEIEDEAPPWEKEGRNPKSYAEIADYTAQIAEKRIYQRQQEIANQQKVAQEQELKRQTEFQNQLNREWDIQLSELEEAGRIPKGPEGKQARIELFKTMNEVKDKRVAQGKPFITNLKEIYYEYYQPQQKPKQPAGANAPVGTSKKSVTSSDLKEYSYRDIATTDMETLVRESMR